MNVPILLLPTVITNYYFKFGRYQFSPRWTIKSFPISNRPCEGLSKFTNFSWSFDTRTALSHVWWFTIPNWNQESGTRRVESESLLLFIITCFTVNFRRENMTSLQKISGQNRRLFQLQEIKPTKFKINDVYFLSCMQNDNLYNNPEITLSFL